MIEERWLPVLGFEDAYEVSDLGRVRSKARCWTQVSKHGTPYVYQKRGQLLAPGRMPGGHLSVSLGRRNSKCVHELVLSAFSRPRRPGEEARHLNGTPHDNRAVNLAWGSRAENSRDKKWHSGARTYKLDPAEVAEIKRLLRGYFRGLGRQLAAQFGVSPPTISAIKTRRTHVDVFVD